ncbi:MAG: prepilin-type N-terminal cleavage/methylation domain-containing protein [Desulfuromonadaceae bacterium]|nr:prepilin-type N-terminal cleavage/methylation domain-containing protein [Desulfuromonadaceae bacterium]
MNNRGFTLMELLIVIALIGILSAMGTFAFSQYSKKSHIVNQTRMLYGDLMEYRIKALYEKKNWTFKISPTSYDIYSSADTTVEPVSTVILKYPVYPNITHITFNSRGLTTNIGAVCVDSVSDAVVDSVVISTTRVKIGKKKEGTPCVSDNINAK